MATPTALAALTPQIPAIIAGAVSFTSLGNRLIITESSPSAILNWQVFSVAKGETIQFVQPSATASILNRVTGSAASTLDGLIQANGQVMLLNPNGITVGQSGRVTAASLLLTSSALADTDYLAGRYAFTGVPGQGGVTNHGAIATSGGGEVVLSAPQVSNDGTITVHLGRVVMGAATGFTLDPAGDGLWSYQITNGAAAALVANAGTIAADGGSVQISARTLDTVMRDVINNTGMIEARSVHQQDGEIILDGGAQGRITLGASSVLDASAGDPLADGGHIRVTGAATTVDGVLLARGGAQGGNGGLIETSGESLTLLDSARVDVGSPPGHPGSWLLDPTDFVIDAAAATAIQTGLGSGNVTVTTSAGGNTVTGAAAATGSGGGTNGDIIVAAPITWASNQTLTLSSSHSVLVDAAVSASGNTAGIAITTGAGGFFYTALGAGAVTLSGATPGLTINGTSYTLISDANGLQSMATSGNFALAKDIDLTSIASFQPIGFTAAGNNAAPTTFDGILEGLGHTISHLVINDATDTNLGLISSLNGTVRDLTISAGGVTAGASVSYVGMLAGQAPDGTILNVRASGAVSAGNSAQGVGGVIGYSAANISGNSFNGSVVAGTAATDIGGLVGLNTGVIHGSYSEGTVSGGSGSGNIGGLVGYHSNGAVTGSFSAANVTGDSGTSNIGGLIGYSLSGDVSYSYATGTVVGGSGATAIGGLIGLAATGPTLCYATGSVSGGAGASSIGGLIGQNGGGGQSQMTLVYATGAVSGGAGATSIGGLVGYNNYLNIGQINCPGACTNTLYWDTTTTGQGSAFGTQGAPWTATTNPVGLTDAQSKLLASYTSFVTNPWISGSGGYPVLVKSPYVLTVTPANKTVTYGSSPAYSDTVTNLWPGDAVNRVSGLTFGNSGGATPGVGSYTITASGASATSLNGTPYQFYFATGTLTVTKAHLTVSANNLSKTYGQTASLGVTPTGLVYSDSVTGVSETSAGAAATAAAGSYAITPSAATGTGMSNYAITYATGTLTVNQAPLTVTADNVSKTYGQNPVYSFTPSGLLNSDTVTGATATSAGTAVTAAVGSYAVTPSAATGSGLANYSITYAAGTLTVTPASLTVTADNVSKTYGQSPVYTFTPSGLVNGDTLTAATATSAGSLVTAAVGSYAITPSAATGTGLANYSITYATGTLTVTPANLTVTANDTSKIYGQSPTYSITPSGLVNGDSLTAAATSDGTAVTAAVGHYAITPSAATGTGLINYAITYAAGTLTVTPAALLVTADDVTKVFGQIPTYRFSASGLINSDTLTGATATSAGTAPGAAVGSYAIIPSAATGTGLTNYSITYVDGTLTVTRPLLSPTIINQLHQEITPPGPDIPTQTGNTGTQTPTATAEPGLSTVDAVLVTVKKIALEIHTGADDSRVIASLIPGLVFQTADPDSLDFDGVPDDALFSLIW